MQRWSSYEAPRKRSGRFRPFAHNPSLQYADEVGSFPYFHSTATRYQLPAWNSNPNTHANTDVPEEAVLSSSSSSSVIEEENEDDGNTAVESKEGTPVDPKHEDVAGAVTTESGHEGQEQQAEQEPGQDLK